MREQELKENQEIRAKIQEAIDDYKKKEEAYRKRMEDHSKNIQNVEKKLKKAIDGTVGKSL